MTRRRLSQVLATLLGGVAPMLALDPRCDGSVFKGEMVPVKGEFNGLKVNINVGSNGEAAEPPPHQQSGAPPGSEGRQLVCRDRGDGYSECE